MDVEFNIMQEGSEIWPKKKKCKKKEKVFKGKKEICPLGQKVNSD